MRSRTELHEALCAVLGSSNVYFAPPPNVKMRYPAIVYKRDGIDAKRADNRVYLADVKYTVTIITDDPDNNEMILRLMNEFHASYDRGYSSDNLRHDTLTLYY